MGQLLLTEIRGYHEALRPTFPNSDSSIRREKRGDSLQNIIQTAHSGKIFSQQQRTED